jgi:hypothetical protein
MGHKALVIDALDNVATVLVGVAAHEEVVCDQGSVVVAREEIPAGHKVALVEIAEGEGIRKYGHRIGTAERRIAAGEHVHVHNLSKEAE